MNGSFTTVRMLPAMPDRHLIDVHVLLIGDGTLLLSQRRDPNPAFDGRWHLPSGQLDAGESILTAPCREAEEEVGVNLGRTNYILAPFSCAVQESARSASVGAIGDKQRFARNVKTRTIAPRNWE